MKLLNASMKVGSGNAVRLPRRDLARVEQAVGVAIRTGRADVAHVELDPGAVVAARGIDGDARGRAQGDGALGGDLVVEAEVADDECDPRRDAAIVGARERVAERLVAEFDRHILEQSAEVAVRARADRDGRRGEDDVGDGPRGRRVDADGADVAGGDVDGELLFASVAEAVVVAVFEDVVGSVAGVVNAVVVAVVAVEFEGVEDAVGVAVQIRERDGVSVARRDSDDVCESCGDIALAEFVVPPACDRAVDLERNGVGFDLNPQRPEIQRNDSRKLPLEKDSVDFVFIDPPYSTHVEYSDDERCIGKLDSGGEDGGKAYYRAMEEVIREMHRVLKDRRYMGLYVSDSWRKKKNEKGSEFMPIGFELFSIMRKYFAPVDIISCVRHNKKLELGNWRKAAEEGNFFLRGFNYCFIMRKV